MTLEIKRMTKRTRSVDVVNESYIKELEGRIEMLEAAQDAMMSAIWETLGELKDECFRENKGVTLPDPLKRKGKEDPFPPWNGDLEF